MAIRLSDPAIQELSVVFGNLDGKEYAPRNEEARVLSVKGGEKGLDKVVEALKAYFSSNADLVTTAQFPVSEAEDNIDNDGDGPDDYNQIVSALCQVYGDISQAFCIQDDGARSAAIVKAIDSFLLGLDALRAGDSEKAGARHSAADKAHIEALQAAHEKAKAAVDSMGDHLSALQPQADKAKDKKPYGDVEYADPKNGKYPIDTEEHARAAWSYINQEKNAAEYSADELKTVKDRIRAACKKFGIEISDNGNKAGEVEMTQEEINALVADAAAKAAEAAVAKAQEAAQAQIDAAKAEAQAKIDEANAAAEAAKAQAKADAESAKAAEDAAKAAADAAKAEADALKADAIKAARTPSGSSQQSVQASSSLQAAVKAAMAGAVTTVI